MPVKDEEKGQKKGQKGKGNHAYGYLSCRIRKKKKENKKLFR
jgi:hypothetical protein